MELRVLRYFLAVAREQNITAAAERLYLSQPTLSKQLMDLEKELGKKLFVRGNRKITLTEEGEFLRRHAQEIIDLADKTESAFRQSDENITGDIYIGCAETEGMRILIKVMKRLQVLYPDIHYHTYSGNDEDVADRLDKGLVDFGLFVGNTNLDKYDYLKLPYYDTWGLLMRKDHPLAEKPSITPQDMPDISVLCSRQALEQNELSGWLGYDSKQLNIFSTHNLIRNVIIMVEEGLGCAISLSGLVNTNGTNLIFRPFEPTIKAELLLSWKKYQVFSKAAECFLKTLQSTMREDESN